MNPLAGESDNVGSNVESSYELPSDSRLGSVFDENFDYSTDLLHRRTLADLCETADELKRQVALKKQEGKDTSVYSSRQAKVLSDISKLLLAREKFDSEESFDLKSKNVRILFQYLIKKMDAALIECKQDKAFRSAFLSKLNKLVENWEAEVQELIDLSERHALVEGDDARRPS